MAYCTRLEIIFFAGTHCYAQAYALIIILLLQT